MQPIRHFHYISSSKVDSIFDQITSSKKTIQLKASLNLGPAQFEASSGEPGASTSFSKLIQIEDYLREHEKIGTIDYPSKWIQGKGWSIIMSAKDAMEAVFYFLRTEDTYIALGGSRVNLVSESPNRSGKFGLSFAPDLVRTLLSLERLPDEFLPLEDRIEEFLESGITGNNLWEDLIYDQCHYRRKSTFDTHISFVAKRLKQGQFKGKNIILASPLYVEQSD